MDEILTIIISVITAIGGIEAIKFFFFRKSEKKKAEAEANSAMAGVLKEMSESYQIFVENTKAKIEDDQKYIGVLKEEREELRRRIDDTDTKVRDLQREVARNGRMVESLRPFVCAAVGCLKRVPVTISDSEVGDADNDLEPIDNSVL